MVLTAVVNLNGAPYLRRISIFDQVNKADIQCKVVIVSSVEQGF